MKFGTLVRLTDISEADSKFKALHDMDFTACQLVYKPAVYDNSEAEIIQAAADKYGIEISAQFCGYYDNYDWDNYYGFQTAGINVAPYRAHRIEYVKKAAEFASHLKLEDIVIHAGFVPNDPFDEKYTSMQSAVHTLAVHCKSLGLNLLLETGGEAPIVMLRLIQDVGMDNVFINFDPANILLYGYGNPVDALKVFGKYVRNMHGKDGCLPTDTHNIGEETVVGEGMVAFPEVFRLLKELNYDRYVIIEREIWGEQQIKDIMKAKKFFEQLVK